MVAPAHDADAMTHFLEPPSTAIGGRYKPLWVVRHSCQHSHLVAAARKVLGEAGRVRPDAGLLGPIVDRRHQDRRHARADDTRPPGPRRQTAWGLPPSEAVTNLSVDVRGTRSAIPSSARSAHQRSRKTETSKVSA